jgi:hypothetical protein
MQARHADMRARHADMTARHADMRARHADMQARHADMTARHADMTARHADMTAAKSRWVYMHTQAHTLSHTGMCSLYEYMRYVCVHMCVCVEFVLDHVLPPPRLYINRIKMYSQPYNSDNKVGAPVQKHKSYDMYILNLVPHVASSPPVCACIYICIICKRTYRVWSHT